MERSGLGRVPVALLVLLVPVSIVIFGLVGPALASQPGVQPVTETDQKLLIAVRQAGLWEIPAGKQAQERAASEVVKEVGAKIAEQNDVVKGHMTMLESTGEVNYDALPEPAIGDAVPAHSVAAASARTGGGVDPGLVAAICLVEAGVTVGLIRLFRSR